MEDGTERETRVDVDALKLLVAALLPRDPAALDRIEAELEAYAGAIGRADIRGAPEAVEILQRARELVQAA
jgi:hypothetical protein